MCDDYGGGTELFNFRKQLIIAFPESKELTDTLTCEINSFTTFSDHSLSISPVSSQIQKSEDKMKSTHIKNPSSSKTKGYIEHQDFPTFSISKNFPHQSFSPVLEKLCTKYSHIFSLQDTVIPPH